LLPVFEISSRKKPQVFNFRVLISSIKYAIFLNSSKLSFL